MSAQTPDKKQAAEALHEFILNGCDARAEDKAHALKDLDTLESSAPSATEQATYGDVVTNAADHVGIPREQIDRFLGTLQMCGWQVSPVSERKDTPGLAELCAALGWQGGTIHQVVEQVARMRAALQEITRGAGPYNRDPLTHADNCIEAMKGVATGALEGDWNPEAP